MKASVHIFRTTIYEYFAYRLNFLLWRFRIVINFFVIFFLWKSVYSNQSSFFGYSINQIQTYLFVSTFLVSVVLSTRISDLAGEIINGDIIGALVRPYPIIRVYACKDIADKTINIFLAIIETVILIILLKPSVTLNANFLNLILFLFYVGIGIGISFYINLLLSCVAFWSNDVWAPRFIYFIVVVFLAGSYFPLDVLPNQIYSMLLLTPFPYLFFLQTKGIIHGFGHVFNQIPFALFVPIVWLYLLKKIADYFWSKGIKSYSFFGR